MTEAQLEAWFRIISSAHEIGDAIVEDIKGVMHRRLTPEENQQVLAQWEDNAARSARNAGLPE